MQRIGRFQTIRTLNRRKQRSQRNFLFCLFSLLFNCIIPPLKFVIWIFPQPLRQTGQREAEMGLEFGAI